MNIYKLNYLYFKNIKMDRDEVALPKNKYVSRSFIITCPCFSMPDNRLVDLKNEIDKMISKHIQNLEEERKRLEEEIRTSIVPKTDKEIFRTKLISVKNLRNRTKSFTELYPIDPISNV
jgi:hypothetical protein